MSNMSQYKKGQSGNPKGRPKGARDKRAELKNLLLSHSEALVEKAVELALSGDSAALKLCLDRILPKAKNDALNVLNMPIINDSDPKALVKAGSSIINAVSTGSIAPEEGTAIFATLEGQRKLIETIEVRDRIDAIELKLK